jgi:hypothetical protein
MNQPPLAGFTPSGRVRRVVQYVSSLTAGATLGLTTVTTVDDNYPKMLKSVYVNPTTEGIEIQVSGGGFTFEDFDASRCSNGNWPVHCDEGYPSYITFGLNVINHTGSSYSGAIVFEYEPDMRAGVVSGARQ